MTREKLFDELGRVKAVRGFDANDKLRQDQAMMSLDVSAEFARLLKARLLTLEGDCGHLAPGCESQKLNPAVAEFLQSP
jgi:hypothetical protein